MFQRDPHCVIASALLTADGEAFGSFVEADNGPGFKLEIGKGLFELLNRNLGLFRKVDPELPIDSDTYFAFILVTYDINPRMEICAISFSEATGVAAICDELVQIFKLGRNSIRQW